MMEATREARDVGGVERVVGEGDDNEEEEEDDDDDEDEDDEDRTSRILIPLLSMDCSAGPR